MHSQGEARARDDTPFHPTKRTVASAAASATPAPPAPRFLDVRPPPMAFPFDLWMRTARGACYWSDLVRCTSFRDASAAPSQSRTSRHHLLTVMTPPCCCLTCRRLPFASGRHGVQSAA